MVRKMGQIVHRGPNTWLVRIYVARDPETRKRKYVGKFIHGGLRFAQTHLDRMFAERDLGRNIRASRQTLGEYLDHLMRGKRVIWSTCENPLLRGRSVLT